MLTPGTRLGPYEITGALGAGGMGEVYRARDTTLRRDVAIKILPEAFANDTERVARFEREATTLASLNHPHIAQIYGVATNGRARGLVMELVEGETLADHIARGAIPVDQALAIARQLAEALDAAHERGIVHRDVKPANVKVARDGQVKVLDFGLAKAGSPVAPPPGSLSNSPTMIDTGTTQQGIVLGTAAYMSPEQATGKAVDKRADIWAFGVVLYEMLTGAPLFGGETASEIIAAVLRAEPDWTRLPRTTPLQVRRLLARCLTRDPRQRLRDIGDAHGELTEQPTVEPAPQRHAQVSLAGIAAVVLVLLAGAFWLLAQPRDQPAPNFALSIVPPAGIRLFSSNDSSPEISPDGMSVLFRAGAGYYVRRLDRLEAMLIPGSEDTTGKALWSPDSTSVAFPTELGVASVRLPSGAPQLLARWPEPAPTRGGSWSHSNTILMSTLSNTVEGTLVAIPGAGGEARLLTIPQIKAQRYYFPEFLPGSDDFLFLADRLDGSEREVYVATLRDGRVIDPVPLLRNETAARYTPARGGRILFVRNDNLYAQKLNREARRLEGDAELVVEGVASQPGVTLPQADFSVAHTGTMAWRPGTAASSQVTMFDRQGAELGTTGPPSSILSIVISPDDTRLLVTSDAGGWLMDIGQSGRRTLPAGVQWRGWSPDASKIVGVKYSERQLVERGIDETGEPRVFGEVGFPSRFAFFVHSPDLSSVIAMATGGSALWWARSKGNAEDRRYQVLSETGERVFHPRFSPDGHWIVYAAAQAGGVASPGTLFVQPFPGPGRRRQIAAAPAWHPEWRSDGKEIVYLDDRGGVWSVPVGRSGEDLRFGPPQRLFSAPLRAPGGPPLAARQLAVSREGSRFFYAQRIEQSEANFIHVTTQWISR